MTDSDGYLSRDRQHLARQQRERRARMVRIDYMPGKDALAMIAAMRATQRPGSVAATNSAVLDAIVTEWAALTGIKYSEVDRPMSPEIRHQYVQARVTSVPERSARAQDFGRPTGINARIAGARADAYDSGRLADTQAGEARRQAVRRVVCGAQRHRDGLPCRAMSEPGKRRCRFHGGRSTGPTTAEGRKRSLANLMQFRIASSSTKSDATSPLAG